MEELYKLNTVATYFGARYSKKVLIGTFINSNPDKAEAIKNRAKDMGIKLVSGVDRFNDAEWMETIKSLCAQE